MSEPNPDLLKELLGSKLGAAPNAGFFKHGKNLTYDDLPYEGPVLDYKEDDPSYKKPQYRLRAHVRVFELSDPKDLHDYEAVWQSSANGTVLISKEIPVYDEEKKTWRIFLRWGDQYYCAPTAERVGNAEAARVKHGKKS